MPGWLSIIFFVLTNLPKLIGLVMDILRLIRKQPANVQPGLLAALKEAYQLAHKTGDSSGLTKLHDSLCQGVACPSDLVGN